MTIVDIWLYVKVYGFASTRVNRIKRIDYQMNVYVWDMDIINNYNC